MVRECPSECWRFSQDLNDKKMNITGKALQADKTANGKTSRQDQYSCRGTRKAVWLASDERRAVGNKMGKGNGTRP